MRTSSLSRLKIWPMKRFASWSQEKGCTSAIGSYLKGSWFLFPKILARATKSTKF